MAFHCRQDIQEKKWSKEATPLVVNKEKTTIEDVGMKVEQAVQMFDRRFTDTLLTHFCYYRSRLSTDGRLMIGQYSDQHLTNTRPTLRRNIDRYVDRHSTDIRRCLTDTVCRSADMPVEPHISHKICRSYSLYEFVILTLSLRLFGKLSLS